MNKIIFLLITLLSLQSCSSTLKSRTVDQYYTSTGVEKYFLSEVPDWANFSQTSACFRSKRIRYFNLEDLMKSFSLKYKEAIQIQGAFNQEYLSLKNRPEVKLTLKDEEVLFFKASEKISSKLYYFEAPTFKQIHLIWLDEALKGKKEEERLRAFLNSSTHDNGVPVLISACLTKDEIEAKFPDMSLKILGAELFSIYDEMGTKKPSLHLNVGAFFNNEQKIIFYSQGSKKIMEEIIGNYKLESY